MKLQFELVPDSVWGSNLRSILSKAQWDVVRKEAYARANGRCMICGKETLRLEAHEKWSYDLKTETQKLEDVIAICKACHETIHIGRTQLIGRELYAEKHFCKVNACTYAQYRKALGDANEMHRQLNQVKEWKLDLSYLKKFC
jgi:phage terminase large subunit GpA-like protein